MLAQDQTGAAFALRHHGLGAWRPGAAWSLGGGAVDGQLRYVANVRTGFTDQDRRRLPAVLAGRGRTRPVVHCPHRGLWVEPDLFCQVNYLEWTRAGRLRGASFHGLLAAP